MEFDISYSPCERVISERKIKSREESSSNSSTDEQSYISSRNQRKRFWKGDEHEMSNDGLPQKMFSIHNDSHSCSYDKTKTSHAFSKDVVNDTALHKVKHRDKRTTIMVTNVPVKFNNILDLYHIFSQFGTLTLIQAQRNSNPFCAILSFQTTEEAIKAMKNIKNVITNGEAVWFLDFCVVNKSVNFCNDTHTLKCIDNGVEDLCNKLNYTPVFDSSDHNVISQNIDVKYEKNLENAITELIWKKKKLLFHQKGSLREILTQMDKYQDGSKQQKILLELLNKIQREIYENRKGIEYSLRQKMQYIANKNTSSPSKPSAPTCPPWITAYKSSRKSCKKISKRFRPKLRVNQTFSRNKDNFTSTSASGNECSDSSEDSVSMKDFYSHAYRKMKTKRTRRKNPYHVKLDSPQDERYVHELDGLLSDSTNDWQEIDL